MPLKDAGAQDQRLKKVALGRARQHGPWHAPVAAVGAQGARVVVEDVVAVLLDQPLHDHERGRPVLEALVLVNRAIVLAWRRNLFSTVNLKII